jgi:hypothetical protein
VCQCCNVRWWTGAGDADRCPSCGESFAERDRWRAESFQPVRLTMARECRGLGIQKLAAMVDMPIVAFEAPGAPQKPTNGELLLLARRLEFPPAFFTNPVRIDQGGVTFFCSTSIEMCYDEECGENAVAVCDFPLAGGGTCDLPMCSRHGKRVGRDRDHCLHCVTLKSS